MTVPDRHNLLGSTFRCECGRTHAVPVKALVCEPGASAALPGLFAAHTSAGRLLLLADKRTWAVAGETAAVSLQREGLQVVPLVVPDSPSGGPACDDTTRAALEPLIPAGIEALLAVGAGTVNDLAKWIAKDRNLPYMVFATAASMNGYTSANIAPAIGGVKRLLEGRAPFAVAADPAILAAAPAELAGSGLGDVLAKPVSLADWALNQILFDEYFCPLCARLIRDLEPGYMDRPEDLRARRPEALEALFRALLYSGLSMTLAGSSAPASGGEHLVSHALDMKAMAEGGRHDLHGRQVGVGTLLAAALYERLLALENPVFQTAHDPVDRAFWGSLTPVVEAEYARKRERAGRAAAVLRRPGIWDQVRHRIREHAAPAARIKDCLTRAGAAHRAADIGCLPDQLRRTFEACHQLRARYTVLDLALAAGLMPGAAGEIVDQWALA